MLNFMAKLVVGVIGGCAWTIMCDKVEKAVNNYQKSKKSGA